MCTMTLLTTPRLHLVPLTLDDVDLLHAMWRDPEVRRYLWDDVEIARERAAEVVGESVRDWERHRFGLWIVHERGEAIGFAGFIPAEDDHPELVFGLLPRAWHRGLATEAAGAVLRYLSGVLGHGGAWAVTDAANVASQRVLERLGMRFDDASGRWRLRCAR